MIQGLSEMRDWIDGNRSANDFRTHAGRLVRAAERQEKDLENAYRLLRIVVAAGVMGPGWEIAAKRLIGRGEINGSLCELPPLSSQS